MYRKTLLSYAWNFDIYEDRFMFSYFYLLKFNLGDLFGWRSFEVDQEVSKKFLKVATIINKWYQSIRLVFKKSKEGLKKQIQHVFWQD